MHLVEALLHLLSCHGLLLAVARTQHKLDDKPARRRVGPASGALGALALAHHLISSSADSFTASDRAMKVSRVHRLVDHISQNPPIHGFIRRIIGGLGEKPQVLLDQQRLLHLRVGSAHRALSTVAA